MHVCAGVCGKLIRVAKVSKTFATLKSGNGGELCADHGVCVVVVHAAFVCVSEHEAAGRAFLVGDLTGGLDPNVSGVSSPHRCVRQRVTYPPLVN